MESLVVVLFWTIPEEKKNEKHLKTSLLKSKCKVEVRHWTKTHLFKGLAQCRSPGQQSTSQSFCDYYWLTLSYTELPYLFNSIKR